MRLTFIKFFGAYLSNLVSKFSWIIHVIKYCSEYLESLGAVFYNTDTFRNPIKFGNHFKIIAIVSGNLTAIVVEIILYRKFPVAVNVYWIHRNCCDNNLYTVFSYCNVISFHFLWRLYSRRLMLSL